MAAPILNATPGDDDANSYATLAEALTYHEAHLYPDGWFGTAGSDGPGDDRRTIALIQATAYLDRWFAWKGAMTSTSQALQWPRIGAIGPNGLELSSLTIPGQIRDATCELARQLLERDRMSESDAESQGLSSLAVGSVSLMFKSGNDVKPIPDAVLILVSDLGRLKWRTGGAVSMTRG